MTTVKLDESTLLFEYQGKTTTFDYKTTSTIDIRGKIAQINIKDGSTIGLFFNPTTNYYKIAESINQEELQSEVEDIYNKLKFAINEKLEADKSNANIAIDTDVYLNMISLVSYLLSVLTRVYICISLSSQLSKIAGEHTSYLEKNKQLTAFLENTANLVLKLDTLPSTEASIQAP
jgi:hypothetical protein